ncbi:MAG: hypothetical protein JJ866_15875 [Roseibium sp.]|uniref:hypothetical protein n=1 Tax=Roseibium sp. TaxID=1936156 RepID=UPI001B256835|nr:hypothetical protein [Roseibium sp.]MBO6893422.1 hypothetical protein [Roseibium sp.]MBO6930611.1 hypothetical protein [Roseibium sp.]
MKKSQDPLIFGLIQVRLRARQNDLAFPKEVLDQTGPLLAEADHKIREARALYGRVNEIHKANEGKRLEGPEKTQ